MAGAFQASGFQNSAFQTDGIGASTVAHGGGPDAGKGERKRYPPVKPLGLPSRRKTRIEDRIEAVREIHEEVKQEARAEFLQEPVPVSLRPIESLTMSEVHAEIGRIMRANLENDNQERLLLLLLMAGS